MKGSDLNRTILRVVFLGFFATLPLFTAALNIMILVFFRFDARMYGWFWVTMAAGVGIIAPLAMIVLRGRLSRMKRIMERASGEGEEGIAPGLRDVLITGKIKELASKDPGALDVEPMTIEIKEGGGEEEAGGLRPMAAEMVEVRARMRGIAASVTNAGLLNKLQAGIYAGKIEGIALGMTVVLVLFGLILRVAGGM